jgi:hypothetical protein
MSPRKSAADLTLGGRFKEPATPTSTGTLRWHHTELGRRTDCGRYRVVHSGDGWVLLDANWNDLGVARMIIEAQQLAERLESRKAQNAQDSINGGRGASKSLGS